MTDRDKIELPPLPPFGIAPIADEQTVRDYARAAVLADRERRAEQAQPAKPKVHSARWELCGDGLARLIALDARTSITNVTLCWTDDGRAWIESERNRELAKELRRLYSAGASIHCVTAADALDGGAR